MKLNKLLTVVLAVLFVVTAAVPALADRSSTYSHTTMHNGAQVYRHGSISGSTVTASITLSFVSGVAHLPSSDYHTGIMITGYALDGSGLEPEESGICGMYCHLTYPSSKTGEKKPLWSADCSSYLDPSPLLSLSAQTPTFTDSISK